jgi:hypothetical protein
MEMAGLEAHVVPEAAAFYPMDLPALLTVIMQVPARRS